MSRVSKYFEKRITYDEQQRKFQQCLRTTNYEEDLIENDRAHKCLSINIRKEACEGTEGTFSSNTYFPNHCEMN